MSTRILYLDSDYYLSLNNRELTGLNLVIIPEVINKELECFSKRHLTVNFHETLNPKGSSRSVYHPTPQLFNAIQAVTADGNIDIVVIGNNNGAGLYKAVCVANELRSKTIIIWNVYVPGHDEKEYQRLGYTHFASRGNLYKSILELLNN
jgi:hypothetical protein